MTIEARLKSKADQLSREYITELFAERDHTRLCAGLAVKRYQQTVDKSIKDGGADLRELERLTVRAIHSERDYFTKRTDERLKHYKLQFECFLIQFPEAEKILSIREEFEKRLRSDQEKIQCITSEIFQSDLVAHVREVREYKVEELKKATIKQGIMDTKAKEYFARVHARERNERITITTKYQPEEKQISVDEFEGIVRQNAESFGRQWSLILSIITTINGEMEKIVMNCIDQSLLNRSAVFDVFQEIPHLALTKIMSEMTEGLSTVEKHLKIRMEHLRSICGSEFDPISVFVDLNREVVAKNKQIGEQDRVTTELLRIYRKEEREQAIAEFENFKKAAGLCAIMKSLNIKELIDMTNHKKVVIGRGGQASVYSLEMVIEEQVRKVAAKKYTKGSATEIVLCGVSHPNILPYLTAVLINKEIHLISEFCPSTLAAEIENSPCELPRETVIQYITEIVEGMQCLRLHKLYHGDLKPENILIGEDGSVKLADFGVSLTRDEVQLHRRSYDWSGTSEYMAPELLRAESVGAKLKSDLEFCDVWSFANVIWQLMTRRRPYQGIERQKLLKIVGEDCKHPELPKSSNLESLVNLLRRCWIKNNPDRPRFHQIEDALSDVFEEIREMDEEEWADECALWSACGGKEVLN